jgi:hypothetical protein
MGNSSKTTTSRKRTKSTRPKVNPAAAQGSSDAQLPSIEQTCPICGRLLPGGSFRKRTRSPTGRDSTCTDCRRTAERHPAAVFARYRDAAKRNGVIFELTEQHFVDAVGKDCTYCGDALDAPAFDRAIPSAGYTDLNVVYCCWPCNKMKNAFSEDAFFAKVFKIAINFAPPPEAVRAIKSRIGNGRSAQETVVDDVRYAFIVQLLNVGPDRD